MADTLASIPVRHERLTLLVEGAALRIACLSRSGRRAPLLLLHGFGSTKEDYADLMRHPRFSDRTIVAYDAPGFGESGADDLSGLTVPFLTEIAEEVVDQLGLGRFHLAGHSMGGLTALLLANRRPGAVMSFTNIEGNLMPEDCFLSRQIIDYPSEDPALFLNGLIERTRVSPYFSAALFAGGLRGKVRAEAVVPVFRSIVALSEMSGLLDLFIRLPCPRMFVYGSENRSLSYLSALRARGIPLCEIPMSGHFPMYANPPALWDAIGDFIDAVERADERG